MTPMSYDSYSPENCILRRLNTEEILSIYTIHSVRHFPENERKPVSSIERMSAEGIYTGYGLYTKKMPQQLLCYGFFVILPGHGNILLDYFAVLEEYRSLGVGSLFLSLMKTTATIYDGFLIESEDPDYADSKEELHIRQKRLDFYEKNNALFTGIRANVFDVPYRLLYFSISQQSDLEVLYSDFCEIYKHMVSMKNYDSKIHVFMPPKA